MNELKCELAGIITPAGDRWIRVTGPFGSREIPWTSLHESRAIGALLADTGLLLTARERDAFLVKVRSVTKWRERRISDRVGWSYNEDYTFGDGSTARADEARPHSAALTSPHQGWSQSGTLKAWRQKVAAPLAGHPVPMTIVMAALTPPLLDVARQWTNFGLEIVGEGGMGKSSLLRLAASAWGAPSDTGAGQYTHNWNTTVAGVESLTRQHADGLLILDEFGAFAAEASQSQRKNAFQGLVFQVSLGGSRARFRDPAGPAMRLLYLSSSNEPLATLLSGGRAASIAAAADRLLTLPADAGQGYGVFSSLPSGIPDAATLMQRLLDAADASHGRAIRRFVVQLVAARATDEEALKRRIRRRIKDFVAQSKVDRNSGSLSRTAEAFGLIYAAGRFAKDFGVLPTSWKCMSATLKAYELYRATRPAAEADPEAQIKAYAASPGIIDLDQQRLPSLSDDEFNRTAGFLRTSRGHRELMIPPHAAASGLHNHRPLLRSLRDTGVTVCDTGSLTTKRQVRLNKISDRVHVIRLPD